MRARQSGEEQEREPRGAASAVRPEAAAPMLGLQPRIGNAAVSRIVEQRRTAPAIQRVTEDELHQHPPGPSARVRGPRRSFSGGRTPNTLTTAEWQTLPQATRNASTKERVDVGVDPQTLQETDPQLHQSLGNLNRLAPGVPWAAGRNAVIEGIGRADPGTAGHWTQQDARDTQLGLDARAARDAYTETPADRQQRHQAVENTLAGAATPDAMGDLTALLAQYEGVAIGGDHSGAPIWGFLITNMAAIQAAGVSTLYLESIREDGYQAQVDAYLAGGTMSPELQTFVTRYDGNMNLGTTGLEATLAAAQTHGMRVKGVDGRPARRPALSATTLFERAAAMNTYASQAVTRDRRDPAAAGGYLMELGAAHTGMHAGPSQDTTVHGAPFQKDEGFPGVDDLLGIPAVEYEADRFRRLPNP
ncbi:hypothetical protein [Streptomyces acidiscabies]|uniref:hypothetical protein n=1 Tax=Streptomyces acidiscabies TaxID=42234 RepID=UPI00073E1801|nr:hypothetical protein [Streptomyces acidiscabies]GAQ50481.1 hypothetical protein a10_00258 [Streptomyces acidiscabies]